MEARMGVTISPLLLEPSQECSEHEPKPMFEVADTLKVVERIESFPVTKTAPQPSANVEIQTLGDGNFVILWIQKAPRQRLT